ncbi:hypothetical protein [Kiloniella antarctica]|uniref:Uncharacterized protein n=1 Tax=Kiloniella antarctica TaxID=1550907 RepID=A0ABW5BM47_9PROT
MKKEVFDKVDMERPALEYAYRLLEEHTRDGLSGMVGITGPNLHKVIYKNQGDLEPTESENDEGIGWADWE